MGDLKPYVLPLSDGTTSTVLLSDEDAGLRGLSPVAPKPSKVRTAKAKDAEPEAVPES